MQSVESIETRMRLRDRLSMRLLLLFALSFLLALVVIGSWILFSSVGASRANAARGDLQATTIVIDPKLQTDLAKALAFDAVPAVTQVQNPFIDRANLAGTATATMASARTTTPRTNSGAASGGPFPSLQTGVTRSGGSERPEPRGMLEPRSGDRADNTKSRYESWIERQKLGEFVVPESEVLGVEDLVPVGYASGGNRSAEVILFSLSLCRTFSFPAGTRFYDGLLNGFDQREVVFIFQNGLRRKSYATQEPCRPSQNSRDNGASIN